MKIIYFHRNSDAGFSINKVTQTIVRQIDNKVEYYMPYSGSSLKALINNLLFIFKHREKDAIHHITGDIHYGLLALIGRKKVLTVHDTVGLDFNKMNPLKSLIYEVLWFRVPLILADRVLCISEVTKQYLLKYTSRKDIQVIHDAIDSKLSFCPMKKIGATVEILFIGTKDNKNLNRCFAALDGINCHITIIGKLRTEQVDTLNQHSIKYTNKWNLSDEELNEEYRKCDIVSFCSLFEGFGMPALEANQVGRPVLCSNIPVLKEVVGDAACFVDPYNIESIKDGYLRLISNEGYRSELVSRGQENVSKFYPNIIRKQWIDVYKSFKE